MEVYLPTDLLDKLKIVAIGDPITLSCRTSKVDITGKVNIDEDRHRIVANESQLRENKYDTIGRYMGIEEPSEAGITYAIVIRWEGSRTVKQSVPIGAITKVIEH